MQGLVRNLFLRMQERPEFNVALMSDDMTAKGWLPIDLARHAGVSHVSVGRFLRGERRTARMAKKLAEALGQELGRYFMRGARMAS
jgi:transcriptional regulator with XRE-family HTH domain